MVIYRCTAGETTAIGGVSQLETPVDPRLKATGAGAGGQKPGPPGGYRPAIHHHQPGHRPPGPCCRSALSYPSARPIISSSGLCAVPPESYESKIEIYCRADSEYYVLGRSLPSTSPVFLYLFLSDLNQRNVEAKKNHMSLQSIIHLQKQYKETSGQHRLFIKTFLRPKSSSDYYFFF